MAKRQTFSGKHYPLEFEVALAHHGLIEVIQAQTTDLVADWTRLRRTRTDMATVTALFADSGKSDFGEQAMTFFFGNWKLYLEHQIEGDGSEVEYVLAWAPLSAIWVCIDVHKADSEVALHDALFGGGIGNIPLPSDFGTSTEGGK